MKTQQNFFWVQESGVDYACVTIIVFSEAEVFTEETIINQSGTVFFLNKRSVSVSVVKNNTVKTMYFSNIIIHYLFGMT